MTSVISLLETPFLKRDPLDKLHVQKSGRPLPQLNMATLEIVDGNTTNVHHFNKDIYQRNDWICGCPKMNAFYCFPCLLFEGNDQWSTTGFNDLVFLSNAISKHELGPKHKCNMLKYCRFNNSNQIVREPNKRVQKNLQVLEAVIEAIKFCAFNNIPVSDQAEYDPHRFQDILNLISPSDCTLKNYLEQEPFEDLESLKKDVLKAASEVIRDRIVEEIQEAQFVALIVEGGDSRYPRVIILRYLKGCELVERVWKIINRDNMKCFLDNLLTDLRAIAQQPTELVSQSYDQLTLKKQDPSVSLPTKIKSHFPQAQLVYFYGHDVFDVIYSSVSIQKHFQQFASMVWGISKLMTEETPSLVKIIAIFEENRSRFYGPKKLHYDFGKNKVESVYLNKKALLETMKTITQNFLDYPDHVVSLANNYVVTLQDDVCNYMLETFFKLIPYFNKLIVAYKNCLENTLNIDPNVLRLILDGGIPEISSMAIPSSSSNIIGEVQVKIEDEIDIQCVDLSNIKTEVEDNMETDFSFAPPSTSKRKRDENIADQRKERTIDIVQSVVSQLQALLQYRTNMLASQLVDPRNFHKYSAIFPEYIFTTAITNLHYFSAFDSMKLQTELKVLYGHSDFQLLSSSCDALKKIWESNLTSTFPETVKLLKIVLTYPSLTDDPRRCLDTKNKIRRFLSASQGFRNVDCLVYFGCERDIIENMPDFNTKVLKKVAELPGRVSLFSERGK
ncbi:uncharacterized protein LOC123308021 [Coccinella septempunctata]|uniref:uncharacterized protein LOC123308021 n=1 Tax=Coccinella septempunctata TaxID=41139 RepID=UPI001D074BFF|nr:uncharacterized protein LOC123308021 [Coccinella septempunctata]